MQWNGFVGMLDSAKEMLITLFQLSILAWGLVLLYRSNKVRYYIVATSIALISTNLTSTFGVLLGKDGQVITVLLSAILGVCIVISILVGRRVFFRRKDTIQFLAIGMFVFFLPSFFFFLNSPELVADYVFWAKRSVLIMALVMLGYMTELHSKKSLIFLVKMVFFINVGGVFLSYFVPEAFLLLVDTDDPMVEKGLNVMGGGFYLNPNGGALAVIFSYFGIIYLDRQGDNGRFGSLVYTVIFVLTLAITGSRSGFICGLLITAMLMFRSGAIEKQRMKTFFYFLLSATVALFFLLQLSSSKETINGFSRIVNFNNEGNLDSNESRMTALINSLALAVEHPISGSGFGLRNKLLLTQPHNMYAAYAIDIGLVGLFAFPAFILLVFRRMYGKHRRDLFLPTVVAVLVMGLFDHEILYSKQLGYLLFLAIAFSKVNPEGFHLGFTNSPRVSNRPKLLCVKAQGH